MITTEQDVQTVLYWKPRHHTEWIVAYEKDIPDYIESGYNVKRVITARTIITQQLGDLRG